MPQMAPMPWTGLMAGVLGALMVFVSVVGAHPTPTEEGVMASQRFSAGEWRW
uniref:ATP synthase F0 subunit 8 n=1 Tax=Sphaeroma serratum TaxID=96875 RepID=E3SXC1_SPHSR|nr:ATP synthase F0 subunit 8 [Sphaeroma serratum]